MGPGPGARHGGPGSSICSLLRRGVAEGVDEAHAVSSGSRAWTVYFRCGRTGQRISRRRACADQGMTASTVSGGRAPPRHELHEVLRQPPGNDSVIGGVRRRRRDFRRDGAARGTPVCRARCGAAGSAGPPPRLALPRTARRAATGAVVPITGFAGGRALPDHRCRRDPMSRRNRPGPSRKCNTAVRGANAFAFTRPCSAISSRPTFRSR